MTTDIDGSGGDIAIRCSAFAREQRVKMVGTAGRYDGYLLMAWPLPWPADAGDVAELGPLRASLRSRRIRLQLVHPLASRVPRPHAVLYLRTDPFRGFQRFEIDGDNDGDDGADPVGRAEALLSGDGAAAPADDIVDLLICGHGSRDVCCGSLGVRLANEAAAHLAFDVDRVRLWRTSHTGGHRFAPTAISLPDGMVWGNLDLAGLEQIALRSGSVAELGDHVRGCSGLRSAGAQLLDEQALRHHGWAWLACERRDEVVNDHKVRLVGTAPDGTGVMWEGVINARRELPVPVCRAPLAASSKTETELELTALRRTSPGGPGSQR